MKQCLTIVLFLSLQIAWGQTAKTFPGSFEIVNNSAPEKAEFYQESILKANLETYRLKDSRATLDFKNGFQVVLYSAKELFVKGVALDMNAYRTSTDPAAPLPLFVVFDNGWLGAEVKTTGKSSGK